MTVSDLTGTTWLIDETPTLITNMNDAISIFGVETYLDSNGASYDKLLPFNVLTFNGVYFGMANAVYTPSDGWVDEAYRTVSFTGGSGMTNAMLIAWLEANATQIVKLPNKIVYDGKVLIDLTDDTVEADKLFYGYTAHDASGAVITGTIANGDPLAYGSSSYLIGTARIGTGYVWTTYTGDICIAGKSEVGEANAA